MLLYLAKRYKIFYFIKEMKEADDGVRQRVLTSGEEKKVHEKGKA